MRKVIGVGETILDILFKDGVPYRAIPGGSVFNGFVSLRRLGVPGIFISELGNDPVGDMIHRFMDENGISTGYLDRYPDRKSPVSLAFLDEKHHADYVFYHDYPDQRLAVPLPKIEEDDIFIFGSYYALNPVLREQIVEFLDYARERKAIIYYDPNFRKAHAHDAIRLTPTVLDNLGYADIVRGSDEDFFHLFGETNMAQTYAEHIQFYCPLFVSTHGADGVSLFTGSFHERFNAPSISPVSTIGAGDNFNAGLIYGLLKYDIRHDDLATLGKEEWGKIIRCGMDLATEVCLSNDNYISKDFASTYTNQS
ncbi:MAG: carbohydrate kinase [Tannerellaceae bacterium]|jgi:fructokinase|nr:carbohydrate kinase [Tannerellaceae bacterium]